MFALSKILYLHKSIFFVNCLDLTDDSSIVKRSPNNVKKVLNHFVPSYFNKDISLIQLACLLDFKVDNFTDEFIATAFGGNQKH